MSGEIKLKCWQRCPKTTLEKQKTSFIASGKLPDNFWVDLFERKCPEGLGAVSENLKNGGFLTAEDFLDPDQNTTQIQEANSGKKTLYSCSGGQQADESVGFKTPCAKRRQSVIGTPSLFSQVEGSQCSQNVDEDVTDTSDVFDTPASLLKASGHHFVGFNKLSSLNPVSPDDGPCTSSPQRYTNEKSMLLRTPTPDILAMMSSHRPSVKSLSYLLAEDLNDDTTEWSESMATPPLEWDNDANEVAKDAECDDSKEQAHSKPVARVLFSRGTTRDSVSDLSMTSLKTLEDTDVTGIETCNPLFDSLYRLENTTKEEATLNQEQPELQSVTPKETSRFMHTLAQSTPKPGPAQLDSNPLLTTPLTRPKSSPVIFKKRRGTGHDREIDVSLETLLTPSTERSLVRAAEELSNSNGHVDACDVMFGSPCQSFEQAMALEAEKVNQAEVPDLASPGDVISLQLSKETTGQSNVLVPSLYKGENAFPECREQPLEETSLRRPSSPWKAPGLRLSKTKRFSYPVLSRVYKDDDKRSLQLSLVNENALEVARTTKSASSTVDCHQQSKGGNVVSQVLQTSYDQDSEPDVIPAAVKELSASGDLMEKEISTSKRDDKGSSSVDGERYFMSNQEDRSLSLKARRKLSTEDVPQPKRPKMERQVEIPGWNPTEILQKTRASPANDGNHSAVSVLVKEETSNNRPGSAVLSTTENTSCVGFRTGSGNLITVSEESLEKARSILIAALEDDDGGASGCFPINSSSAKDKRAVEHVNLVDMDDLTQFPDECMSPSNTSHLTKTTVSTYKANLQAPLEGTVGHSGEPSKIHYSARGGGMVHGQGAPSADFSEKRTEHLRPISRRECWTERSGQEEHYFTSSFQDGLTQVEVSPTLAVNFVGFHTAAGKTVQISEKSLKKARGLLQDIEADLDNRNVVGSEKQQSRTISAKVTDANPDENTANDGRCEQAITRCVHVASVNDESCSSNGGYSREDGVPDVCGFQTANGRKIELSEEALKKATATMKEMGVSLGLDNSGDSELSKQVGAEVSRTTATKWKSDSPGVPEGRRHSGIPFQGFQTASGKTVRVSEKALQKARKTISEIDREIMHLQPTTTETLVKMKRKESKETEEAVENLTIKPENGDNKLRRGGANRSVVTECRPGGERKEEIPTETLEKANFIVDATGRISDGDKKTKGFHGTPGTDADTAGVVEDVEALTERIQPMEGVVNQVVKATEKEGGDYDIKGFSVVQTTRSTEIDTLEEALMAMDGIEQELCCGTQDVSKYGNTGLAQSETSSWREVGVSEGNKGRMTMGKNEVQDATRRKYFQGDDVGSGDKIEISKDMKAISAIHQNIRDVQGVSGKTNHQGGCAGFVGFYTASGNQVNISEEAFKKANVTMHEIYQDLQSVRHDESTREDNSLCAGFQAVSGKKVDISEMALKEAKTALSEIDLHLQNEQKMEKASKTMDRIDEEFQSGVQNVEDRGTGFTGFQAANGKKVGVSEEALKKARITIDQIDQDLRSGVQKAGNKGDSSFAGFQTTSGKEVSVSEEALKKARMTMDQIDQNLHSGIQKAGNKGELHGFAGFQTASGKKVNVSDEALKKARITMDRIDQDLRSGVQKVGNKGDSSFAGFQTASGKKVSVSEEALKKARMTMDQIDQNLHSGIQKAGNKGELHGFAGFQTASGKKVSVSDEALKKARMTMDRIDQDLHSGVQNAGNKNDLNFAGFQTASGKNVRVSEEALKKAMMTMDQIDQDLHSGVQKAGNKGELGFARFQTASGKKVSVSDEALKKAMMTMDQIDQDLHSGVQKAGNKGELGFAGFQAANGKKVSVSEEALKKAMMTMDQIDQDLHSGVQNAGNKNDLNFAGFQTASGKKVRVSEEALKKARMTMDQIDQDLQSGVQKAGNKGDSGFAGFQTAGGKKVSVSEEALKKARMTMDQIDQDLHSGVQNAGNKEELGFAGFQTAGGKKVSVSEVALKKARMTMDQIDQDLQSGVQKVGNKGDSSFAGFQTASGKKVSVFEESLQKARMTMDQIDQDLHSGVQKAANKGELHDFAGFQTADGKKISVSEEALKKARMAMDQIDQDLHSGLRKNGSKGELGFTGFQTAGGKKVSISEEALKKARTTMDQIDQDLRRCRDNDGNAVTVVCQTEGEQKTDSSFKKSNSKVQEVEVNFSEDTPPRKQFTTYQQKNSKVTSENYGAFQTGSGRTVQVSEKALEKARATLDEIDRSLGEVNTSTDNIRFECKSSRLDNCESETAGDVTLQVTPTPSMALSISDDVVSREILESSKALLADESFQEFLSTNNCITSTPCSAAKTPQAERTSRSEVHLQALPTVRTPHARNILQRNSTPFISHDDTSRGQVKQRSDMKAMKSTPSGVLYDRRSSRLSLPLTPQTINSDTNAGRPSARTGIITGSRVSNGFSRMHRSSRHVSAGPSPRAISPIQTSTSRSPDIPRNAVPLPRRGVTPFSSTAGRNVGIPRPHFSTPYRNSERGNRMNGEVSSESVSPSAKKPRLSGPPGLMSSEHGGTSNHKLKGSSKVKPQLGFLFKLRQHQGRTSLRQYVGNTKPARYSKEELYNLGVNKEVVAVTCSNAASFRFDGAKYFSDDVRSTNQGTRTEDGGLLRLAADGWLGLNEIQSAFLSTPGVERGLISDEWIENHYRWIVWKLAAMEVSFPSHFAGRCLTPHWILCQLKYRYDREVDHSHRSSLKKILERDDVSTRTMVLCVSGVCVTEDTKEESVSSDGQTASKQEELAGEKPAVIQVTDGWYDTRALLDKPLTRLLTQGRIQVGQKLCVYGADLVGSDQAVSPLEAPSSLMLRFHANSTRRARWDARLGLQRHAHAFPLKLASLFPDGGLIGCIDVIVLRQYPLQWMEKMPDGSNVFRSPRVEEREAQRFDRERQRRREALFMRVEREFEKESSQPELDKKRKRKGGQRSFNASQMETLRDGRDIHDALSMASDPDAFMSALDDEQRKLLDCYTCSFHESRRMELQAKFEQAWSEQEEHQTERNVVALLKVRVADYCKDSEEPKIAVLSVWRPSKEVMSLLSEGARLKIYHATASASRHRQGTEIQLSGTRTTRYQTLPVDPGVKCRVYSERKTTSFGILTQKLLSPYTEVDLVGVVVFCSPQTHSSVQTVYLADEEQNLVTIKFWGGLKAHALEGLVKPRCLVASSNLLVRPDDHVTYACLTFGDLSCLTLKPRDSHLRRALETLQSSIKSMDVFMAEIQEKLNSVLPKGFPFGTKQTGSRSHAVSPETPKLDQEDSPASKTLNSSRDTAKLTASGSLSRGMKSRQCKRKLLEGIPEPPPLSPLTCTVSAGARKEFKRPKRESDVHKHEEDLE